MDPEPTMDWEARVRELRERKAREPGVRYILSDEDNNIWRV